MPLSFSVSLPLSSGVVGTQVGRLELENMELALTDVAPSARLIHTL
jgi:hypothetical protein